MEIVPADVAGMVMGILGDGSIINVSVGLPPSREVDCHLVSGWSVEHSMNALVVADQV